MLAPIPRHLAPNSHCLLGEKIRDDFLVFCTGTVRLKRRRLAGSVY